LAIALAYYAGANIGFILRFPPQTPSVLWPPNSILTAALLLTPVRRWWLYLLAALPAHLLAEAQAGWPMPLVLSLFATNCSEALLAAACVRRWSDEPTRLDTLRRVFVFVAGAGVFAPFASSFLDAGVVTAFQSEPYWLVWRTRFFSNVLTELTVAPAIVVAATSAWPWIRHASTLRKIEAALLAIGLGTVAFVVFADPSGTSGLLPELPHVPVALFLPLILWAAVRFGPGGITSSMLATTLILTWAATHGRGPFAALLPSESVLALQLYLTVSVVPLMCLAGLIEERRRAQRALAERLRFEELVARLSRAFVHLPSDQMDESFGAWLEHIGRFLSVDRVLLLRLSRSGSGFCVAHSWDTRGPHPAPWIDAGAEVPWMMARLICEEPVVVARPEDIPEEAIADRESVRRSGIRSLLVLPLSTGARVLGGLTLITTAAARAWSLELASGIPLVAEVFANALARKESEDALRASELMKSAILASLNSGVAVLDSEGRIIAVNQAWARFARQAGAPVPWHREDDNYLHTCRAAVARGEPEAAEALAGIEAVLSGSRTGFAFEYSSNTPAGEHWVAISVVPLSRPEGGAVVSRTDVTERKRAEMEAERARQELAHFTRVSTMGELTASLAHELRQPLAGILTNAQAAQRFLAATPPDLDEVREILADIVKNDRRATQVIQRLRDLVRRGDSEMRPFDLNDLIRDVVKLLASDTIIRGVTVELALAAESAVVRADPVQIQQVVLNLLLNAMEAMAGCPRETRLLVIRTENPEPLRVQVSVDDAGPGLSAGVQGLMFDPFYTTKPHGMGMGLAIARSIIELHRGVISAENTVTGGATLRFSLPVDTCPSP
jgi:C4-dicarboxylate-specific signal transduction histidine kinase/integral membrane sensor domain MASE1